jgi:hypothetical protein
METLPGQAKSPVARWSQSPAKGLEDPGNSGLFEMIHPLNSSLKSSDEFSFGSSFPPWNPVSAGAASFMTPLLPSGSAQTLNHKPQTTNHKP